MSSDERGRWPRAGRGSARRGRVDAALVGLGADVTKRDLRFCAASAGIDAEGFCTVTMLPANLGFHA